MSGSDGVYALPTKSERIPGPRGCLRAIVYCQAAFRRCIDERHMVEDDPAYEEEQPPPPVAVALFFCRKNVMEAEGIMMDIESEAIGMATTICGRDRGLTLGVLNELYKEYEPYLDPDHPVLQMALERFREVLVSASEDMLERMRPLFWPSEGREVIKKCREDWGMPEMPPDGDTDEPFPAALLRLQELQTKATMELSMRLGQCQTREAFDNLQAALDRELPGMAPSLRGRLRSLMRNHRSNVLEQVTVARGWPPRGKISELSMVVRWYKVELGEDPSLEDYISFTRRLRSDRVQEAVASLSPIAEKLHRLRAKLAAYPPPPKLIADGFREEIETLLTNNHERIRKWRDEMWYESPETTKVLRGVLGEESFIGKLESDASEWAQAVRDCGPKPPIEDPEPADQAEVRCTAEVSLAILVDVLRAQRRRDTAAALSKEFATEIERVQHLVHYLDDDPNEKADFDDGWGKPPGFEVVERPENPPPTPPPTPPPPPPRPPTPPVERGDMHLNMRLHGVTRDDLQVKSEILLLDKCAAIIAQECGIPREWITNIECIGGSATPRRRPTTASSSWADSSRSGASSRSGRSSI